VQLRPAKTISVEQDNAADAIEEEVDPTQASHRKASLWRHARRYMLLSGLALVLAVAGGGLGLYLVVNSTLSGFRTIKDPFTSIPAAQRPPVPPGALAEDVTFLVGGVDTRSAVPTTGRQAQSSLRGRTDTLMLVHLIAGGRGAYIVSIPRDSWVPIPGHGMGKVNWAYYFGGQTLAVRTVEQLTHVRIDHVAVIDWAGFRDLTDELGGITITIPVTSYDPSNHVTWTKGTHHLDGAQALLYVRDRYGLVSGDFGREARQQNFLRAVFWKLHDEASLRNPFHVLSLVHDLTQAISVDTTVTNSDIEHWVLSMRGMNPSSIIFTTVPYEGTGQVGSQSVVNLKPGLDRGFWHAFEYDTLPAFMAAHDLQALGATTP
jgi:LCP family protein required for cell wall assembly